MPAQGEGREPAGNMAGNMVGDMAISARGLVKDFDSFRAVAGVSFEVARGEIFGFLGPNGAGKSTTIRMLTGLLLPTSGQGSVGGFDLLTQADRIKQNIGYMSQKFSLYEDLTAEENLTFFGGIYGLPAGKLAERREEVLGQVGLLARKRDLTRTLSGGLRQRLALASALIHEPSILFLDEPTSGVDPISRRNFWDMIYALAERGVTVLVTTHYMDEAEFCDRLVLIYQGRVVAQGTPRQLKRAVPEEVIAVYPDRLTEALGVARSLPQVKEAAIFGDGIHVATPSAAEALPVLERALRQAGIEVRSCEKIEPSLEDAFISFIERAGNNQAGGETRA